MKMNVLRCPLMFVIAISISCSSNPNIATTSIDSAPVKVAVKAKHRNNNHEVSFEAFLKRFNSDSVFQKAHVKFPLKMELPNEEEDTVKYLSANKWAHFNFVSKGQDKFTTVKLDNSHYVISYQIEDTGFFLNYYFGYKNGEWKLESTKDMGD
ncbi:hypothetical protein A0256_10960 [Mucilaginibacter sp. PAMC 26640]|nr:hypothetical protein A0256_10960 [Mucilaginibacter sp. PAMC 26640]